MAVARRTLNLGSPATTIGRPPQSAPQSRADILGGDMPSSSNAAWVGRAAALEGTPTVESGNVLEALAAALEGGIRGRAAYGEYNREQDASQRAQALAQQQADREYKGEIQDRDLRARALEQQAPETYDPPTEINGRVGQRGQRSGLYNWAPQLSTPARPYGMGTIPSGYQLSPDGQSLVPIQGGPAAARVDAASRARAASLFSQVQQTQNVLTAINQARQLAQNPMTTGLAGQVLSGVGGQPAHDLAGQIETIVSNIGFDRLQAMRDASPTGGALGQVTERELALLQSVVANLRQSQSQAQFLRNLDRVEQQYQTSMARIEDAYNQDFGQGAPEASTPADAAPGGPQRLRWNPQTGQLEDAN